MIQSFPKYNVLDLWSPENVGSHRIGVTDICVGSRNQLWFPISVASALNH